MAVDYVLSSCLSLVTGALVALAGWLCTRCQRDLAELQRTAADLDDFSFDEATIASFREKYGDALKLTPAKPKPKPRRGFVDAVVRATDFEWLFAWADRGPPPEPELVECLEQWVRCQKASLEVTPRGHAPLTPNPPHQPHSA